VALVIGLVIGAFIVQWATWPWLFYVFTITGAVVFVAVAILSPSPKRTTTLSNAERFKRLDLGGMFLVTGKKFCFHVSAFRLFSTLGGLVLFIFGVTAGSVNGWSSARCLAPFIISFFLIAAFFVWEARLPEEMAAMYVSNSYGDFNLSTHGILQSSEPLASEKLHSACRWISHNALLVVRRRPDIVLMGLAKCLWMVSHHYCRPLVSSISPYDFCVCYLSLFFSSLPIGIVAGIATLTISTLQKRFPLKWLIIVGQLIGLVGTILLTFADSPHRYFSFVFPGFILGSFGIAVAFCLTKYVIWLYEFCRVTHSHPVSLFLRPRRPIKLVSWALFSIALNKWEARQGLLS
jgi:MFS family permease